MCGDFMNGIEIKQIPGKNIDFRPGDVIELVNNYYKNLNLSIGNKAIIIEEKHPTAHDEGWLLFRFFGDDVDYGMHKRSKNWKFLYHKGV